MSVNATLVSALGPLEIERGYYHCRDCGRGCCPADVAFGLDGGELTAGAAELTCLATATESFAKAAEVILPRMSGLRIAASTAERAAEAVGAEVGRLVETKVPFDEARPWAWYKDAEGMTCAYVSIDLTEVHFKGYLGVSLLFGAVNNSAMVEEPKDFSTIAAVLSSRVCSGQSDVCSGMPRGQRSIRRTGSTA